jgi:hypothetical protein
MNEISADVGFWILEAWARLRSQLQLNVFKGAESQAWTATAISWTSPADSKILVRGVDPSGQNKEWAPSLAGAKFRFWPNGASARSAFSGFDEGMWLSFLLIELPDGMQVLFAEPFAEAK